MSDRARNAARDKGLGVRGVGGWCRCNRAEGTIVAVDDRASIARLRLYVGIRRALIHAPRVRDRRHCWGDNLKHREKDQNPREPRKPRELHAEC